MSRSPTSRSPDLQRLAEEGYRLSLLGGTLVVEGLPYVDGDANVLEGMLIVPLRLAGDVTARPDGHLAWWIGRTPCDARGAELTKLIAAREGRDHGSGLRSTHMLCNKPVDREFRDYHELVTAYSQLLGSHAEAKAPGTMSRFSGPALRLRAMPASGPDAPQAAGGYVRRADASACFTYNDTASARAGIEGLNMRLAGSHLAIVGLGGTGSHVLDLVAKTPVASIHLFDADVFEQHNAFRAPGAATSAEVAAGRRKVHHFAAVYSAIHNGLIPHDVRLGPSNLDLLDAADFVFLCIDDGAAKRPILDRLDARGVPWIDVGMGLRATAEGIVGALRVTVGMTSNHDLATSHVPMEAAARDAYSTNIQVGDLNALNAALAVVEWKRMRGFYADHAPRTNSVFIVEEGVSHTDGRPPASSSSAPVDAQSHRSARM